MTEDEKKSGGHVRVEFDGDITGVHALMPPDQKQRIAEENLYERVKRISKGYEDLAKQQSEVKGVVEGLTRATQFQNELMGKMITAQLDAGLAVGVKRATTAIDEGRERREFPRKLILGATGAGVVTLVTAIVALVRSC